MKTQGKCYCSDHFTNDERERNYCDVCNTTIKGKHTPGPWETFGDGTQIRQKGQRLAIAATDGDSYEIAKANADFIVCIRNSHRELLKACKQALAENHCTTDTDKTLKSAIAKAEGR